MSGLEEQLANAVTEAGALNRDVRNFYDTEKARVEAKLGLVDSALSNLPKVMSVRRYVDAGGGDDTNEGSVDAPFSTLSKAISSLPSAGVAHIHLMSDVSVDVTRMSLPYGSNVKVLGDGGTRRIHFPLLDYTGSGDYDLEMSGFFAYHPAAIAFENIALQFPANPNDGRTILETTYSAVLGTGGSNGPGFLSVSLFGCDIIAPAANPIGVLVGTTGPAALKVNATSYPSTFAGRWVTGVAAGADPAATRHVLSNLSSM